jgi:CO/xanthine dehydrogenase Mo-binding subunit
VRVQPDTWGAGIKVVVHANITESGMGQRSNVLKCVAETLNMPIEWITIVPPDDQLNPFGFGLAGSRGTITWGHAITNAAEDVRRKILQAAELKMEMNADGLEIEGSSVVCPAKPGKRMLIRELTDKWMTFTGYGKHLEHFATPNFFMVMLEVEVDQETGRADVINMLGGTDCGQIIDPPTLEMQCQSGIGAACLDTALFEEHIIDPATGRPLTYNMLEYKCRTFNQFPVFDTLLMESQWDSFQYHAVGVGEIAGAAAASAALTAISNAIGTKVSTYPATPKVILSALGKL